MNQDHSPFCDPDCNDCPPAKPAPTLLPGVPDDGEWPLEPEYSERGDEAFDEMVWQDMAGMS